MPNRLEIHYITNANGYKLKTKQNNYQIKNKIYFIVLSHG